MEASVGEYMWKLSFPPTAVVVVVVEVPCASMEVDLSIERSNFSPSKIARKIYFHTISTWKLPRK